MYISGHQVGFLDGTGILSRLLLLLLAIVFTDRLKFYVNLEWDVWKIYLVSFSLSIVWIGLREFS